MVPAGLPRNPSKPQCTAVEPWTSQAPESLGGILKRGSLAEVVGTRRTSTREVAMVVMVAMVAMVAMLLAIERGQDIVPKHTL